MGLFFFRFLLLFCFVSACASYEPESEQLWSKQTLSIQTLSLYNQRMTKVEDPSQNWVGDWILRRERLEMIDEALLSSAANLIFFQEVMQKKENIYNHDMNILKASSLLEFYIDNNEAKDHKDTHEIESAATALKLGINDSLKIIKKALWNLGEDGYLSYQEIEIDKSSYHFFNLKMPGKWQNIAYWYDFILKRIQGSLPLTNSCTTDHLIVAGYFDGEPDNPYFLNFLKELDLKDSAQGFCELDKNCYTLDDNNSLLLKDGQDTTPRRSDRILVPKSSKIINSHIFLNSKKKAHEILQKKYKLKYLYPSVRSGWSSEIILSSCKKNQRKTIKM